MTRRLSVMLWFATMVPAALGEAATVTNLQVLAQKGQAFVTFREISGSGVTYTVFRSTQPITSVDGLTPIATLDQGSGINRYTNQTFIITDLGSPLASQTGLLVWTTSTTGSYYYAVTNSTDASIVVGTNSLSSPVSETRWEVPGAIQIADPATHPSSGFTHTKYFAWEDYASWRHGSWPYYGFRYDVAHLGALSPGVQYPMELLLHPFDGSGWREPDPGYCSSGYVCVVPRDNLFVGSADPYTGNLHSGSFWYGWIRADNVVVNVTEARVLRFVRLTTSTPAFQVDPTRVVVRGSSYGSSAMKIAYHYPTFFSAALSSIGWTDTSSNEGNLNFSMFVGKRVENGRTWDEWNGQQWLIENINLSGRVPYQVYTFRKDDGTLSASGYPSMLTASETRNLPMVARWMNGGHSQFFLGAHHAALRFRLNEAYPAFARATNSDPVSATQGQRNVNLNWSSSLYSLGSGTGLVDSVSTFAISLRSLSGDATADVTIRNAQAFVLSPGENVTWSNALQSNGSPIESGTAAADATGLVTVRVQVRGDGSRLTLQRVGGGTPPAPPSNLRITGP